MVSKSDKMVNGVQVKIYKGCNGKWFPIEKINRMKTIEKGFGPLEMNAMEW